MVLSHYSMITLRSKPLFVVFFGGGGGDGHFFKQKVKENGFTGKKNGSVINNIKGNGFLETKVERK